MTRWVPVLGLAGCVYLGPLNVDHTLVEKEIGPSGGRVVSADGRFALDIPAGALKQPVTLSIQLAAGKRGFPYRYDVQPGGTTFREPVTVQFLVDSDKLTQTWLRPEDWFIFVDSGRGSGAKTEVLPDVQRSNNQITATTTHLSVYALGSTSWAHLRVGGQELWCHATDEVAESRTYSSTGIMDLDSKKYGMTHSLNACYSPGGSTYGDPASGGSYEDETCAALELWHDDVYTLDARLDEVPVSDVDGWFPSLLGAVVLRAPSVGSCSFDVDAFGGERFLMPYPGGPVLVSAGTIEHASLCHLRSDEATAVVRFDDVELGRVWPEGVDGENVANATIRLVEGAFFTFDDDPGACGN
mgnify:FL=1